MRPFFRCSQPSRIHRSTVASGTRRSKMRSFVLKPPKNSAPRPRRCNRPSTELFDRFNRFAMVSAWQPWSEEVVVQRRRPRLMRRSPRLGQAQRASAPRDALPRPVWVQGHDLVYRLLRRRSALSVLPPKDLVFNRCPFAPAMRCAPRMR